MRGWVTAMVLAAGVSVSGAAGAYELGGYARVLQRGDTTSLQSLEVSALRQAIAEREAHIRALEERLRESQEGREDARAEALGVSQALRRADLPEQAKRRLARTIVREAERNGLDPLLVVAVIHSESSFNPYAQSKVGARGLMQVMPDTGRWLLKRRGEKLGRVSNLFDMELNVQLGTAYLAELKRKFGTVEGALVAYNAGPGAARKILKSEKRRAKFIAGYPRKVVREHLRLRAALEADVSRRLAASEVAPNKG
jgi:soluble lytic murein transglycosylase